MLDGYPVDSKLLAVTFNVCVLWDTGRDDTVLSAGNVDRGATVLATGRKVVQLLVLLPAAFSEVAPGPTVFPSTLGSSTLGRVTRPVFVLITPGVVFGGTTEAVVTGFFVFTATVDGLVVTGGGPVVTKGWSWYFVTVTYRQVVLTGWRVDAGNWVVKLTGCHRVYNVFRSKSDLVVGTCEELCGSPVVT